MNEKSTNEEIKFKEYSYRIVIVALFALTSFVNGMNWVLVSSISVQISNAYDLSQSIVSLIPMSYMILYVFMNYPSIWVLDEKGIKKGIVIGSVLTALGCSVRCFVNYSFGFVIFGQILCAAGQPFILNAPTKITIRWFLPKNKSLTLALLTVSNVLGNAIGFLIPSFFVPEDGSVNSTIQDQFLTLLIFYGILGIITALLIIFFYKESPPSPPSFGAMVEAVEFKKASILMLTTKKSVFLLLAYSTVNGSVNIYASLLQPILQPYNYTSDQISVLGATLTISGIVAAAFFGLYIEKTLKFHKMFIILSIIGVFTVISFSLGLKYYSQNYWAFIIIVGFMGVVLIPLMPLSFDYGCQIMFPIGQAQITGVLMTAGNLVGIIYIVIAQQIIGLQEDNREAAFNTSVFVGIFLIFGLLAYVFFDSELKRSKLQIQKKGSLLQDAAQQ